MNISMKMILTAVLGVSLLVSGNAFQEKVLASSESTSLPEQKAGNWEQLKYTWTTEASGNDYTGTIVGNGRIGARIAGGVATDTLQLNDTTFWSGEPVNFSNPNRRTALANTRQLLAEADQATSDGVRETKLKQAEEAAKGMWGRPSYGARYLPIGKMILDVPGTEGFTGYSRELDLDRAMVTTQYTVSTTTYTREVFASYPNNIIVIRISNNENKPMSLTAKMAFPAEMTGHASVQSSGNEITMTGQAPYNYGSGTTWDANRGMTFDSRLRVKTTGGTVTPLNGNLEISGASEILIMYANATSYKDPFTLPHPSQGGNNPTPIVTGIMNNAIVKSYDELLNSHLNDYRKLFRRLWAEVNGNTGDAFPFLKQFQYTRYEMIASSRENTKDRPRNQQGMWNYDWSAPNDSSHFLNENVEKHYAIIESANLSESGDPLWKWMNNLAIHGAQTAQQDFGFDGWMAPHYSDIWASTALADSDNEWAIWPMGGMWLTFNLYDHYRFTLDTNFLRNTAYPLMKGSAEFALDLLVTNKDGYLVTSPSTSPETRYKLPDGTRLAVSQGTTMDMTLIRQLFHDVLEAASILQANSAADQNLINRINAAIPQLLPFAIGSQGELKEFNNKYPGVDPSHRHASHLIGVGPLDVITKRGTPDLFAAVRKSLELRGSGGVHPDKAYMWTRLGEPDKALEVKRADLTDQFLPTYRWQPMNGYFPELFVQSHTGEVELLPALPSGWTNGKIAGIKARGGYEISMEWANRELVSVQIASSSGSKPVVRYKDQLLNSVMDGTSHLWNVELIPTADDRAASILYSGSWSSDTNPDNYLSTETYSNVANQYAEFTFKGVEVNWIGAKQSNMGFADVYMDGILDQANINLYSASTKKKQLLYTKSGLSEGFHTIKVVVKGTKDPSASNSYVRIDAFQYKPSTSNAEYRIVNKQSGKALGVGSALTKGAAVAQRTSVDAPDQKWAFVDVGSGNYKIVNKFSGLVMDVSGGSNANGTPIIQWTDFGSSSSNNQRWMIYNVGNGNFKIVSVKSGLSLDNAGASNNDGNPTIQWPFSGSGNQLWKLEKMN